jgi:hypothetical protein
MIGNLVKDLPELSLHNLLIEQHLSQGLQIIIQRYQNDPEIMLDLFQLLIDLTK